MPSADFCRPVRAAPATLSPLRDSRQISQGKAQNVSRVDARFIKHTPLRMEDFAVTCPLVPGVPHLGSGSCASPRAFGLGFLQTPPHGDALALLLAFGSARTWREDFHLARSVSCLAHTFKLTGLRAFRAGPVECSVRAHADQCAPKMNRATVKTTPTSQPVIPSKRLSKGPRRLPAFETATNSNASAM